MEVEMYAGGEKKSAIPYKNGQQYGRVKRWYESGQKEEDVMMKNTRVHGSYRSWYSNGNKQREFFSINNVMSGEYREWDKDGRLLLEIIELTAESKILVKSYWPNGKLKMQGKSDMPESLSIHEWSQTQQGYWMYWQKDGTVIKSEKYSKGQLLTVEMP
jgi:antitoxin component YwqK of YwqJK toxin-antitoxin module